MMQLQRDLDKICSVAKSWNLRLNISKCVAMRFGGQKSDEIPAYYNIGGKFLEFVSVHRDLGVEVDFRLRFHEHACEVVQKAGSLTGKLLSYMVFYGSKFMVSLFISHIRPIRDFSSSVWGVGYLGDGRLLVSSQKMEKRHYWCWTSQLC